MKKDEMAILVSNMVNAGERLRGAAYNIWFLWKHGENLPIEAFDELYEALEKWSEVKI